MRKFNIKDFKDINLNNIQYVDNDINEFGDNSERKINIEKLYISDVEIRRAPGILNIIDINKYVTIKDAQIKNLNPKIELEQRVHESSINRDILDKFKLDTNIPLNNFNLSQQNKIIIELMKSTGLIFEENELLYFKSSRLISLLEISFNHLDDNHIDNTKTDNGILDKYYDKMIQSNNLIIKSIENVPNNNIPFINVPLIIYNEEDINLICCFYLTLYQHSDNYNIEESVNLFDCEQHNIKNKEIDPKRFFIRSFQTFLKIRRDSIPFGKGFGNSLKDMLQTKLDPIYLKIIEEEIYEFVSKFNKIYSLDYEFIKTIVNYKSNGLAIQAVIEVLFKLKEEELLLGFIGPNFEQ